MDHQSHMDYNHDKPYRCGEQVTIVVLHWLAKQCMPRMFATKDTNTCAYRHYPPSEYTWAFAALGMPNKEFYATSHETLDYFLMFQFGARQHQLMWLLNNAQ